jgi:hypothetical protein
MSIVSMAKAALGRIEGDQQRRLRKTRPRPGDLSHERHRH